MESISVHRYGGFRIICPTRDVAVSPNLRRDAGERGYTSPGQRNTGGGSLLYGLDKLIQQKTGIHAMVAEDAVSCVAIGTGRYIEFISETAEEEREQKRGFDISGLFKKK